jgi:PAS domain S-box-containing protein
VLRYGLAVASVAIAVIATLPLGPTAFVGPVFFLAVIVSAWFGGGRPGLLAAVLATLSLAYFFLPPLYSLRVDPPNRVPLLVFVLSAALVSWLSARMNRTLTELQRGRDELETRVQERTAELREQAALLDLTHDTVFARDMSDVITYWNRGAKELYGWDRSEIVGRTSHDVLRTVFPAPLSDINRTLLSTGRWEGELVQIKRDGTEVAVASRWSLQRDEHGEPLAILEMNNDITEAKRADEERQGRRWVAESMDRVHLAIQGTNDLEQMMGDVLAAALSIFDCDRAWLVSPCDPDAASHELRMQRTRPEFPGPFRVGEELPTYPDTADVFRTVRAASGPVQFGAHSKHPLPTELAKRLGTRSRIVMAIYPKGDQPYMFGLSQCSYVRVWTAREEELFQRIGWRLADALTGLSMLQRLRDSEKRYRHIFESTGVSIWEEDFSRVKAAIDELRSSGVRDFRAYFARHPEFVRDSITMVKIVDVNAASVKLFAAEDKDQLLTSLDKIFVTESHAAFVEELIAIAERRTFFNAETVLQTLKGEKLTALFTITFPTSSARFDSVLVTVMDITERKRAEYLTGQVFETSPDVMFIVRRDYRYQRVNPAFERRWRMPAARLVGMSTVELVGAAQFADIVKPNLDRCFAGEDVSLAGWLVTPAGRQYLATTYSPLRPHSERVEAALGITRDLTEHMVAVEALQKAQTELAHVTRVTTLGEMAASIAHEVNQPLAAIVADATACRNWLAAARPDLEQTGQALDAIVTEGHRAAEVIQRIRQLATKSTPRKDRLDLNGAVRDVLPLVRAELRHHAVSLRVDLAPELSSVVGDRVQLQQVILNLAMNGIEAMGSVTDRPRELVIRSEPHEHGHVTVAVHDTGVGIDPNDPDRLFNAFFTTKPGGMGMGLSISRSIIEAHGGRLWATPNEPHGAIFLSVPSDRHERNGLTIPHPTEAPRISTERETAL